MDLSSDVISALITTGSALVSALLTFIVMRKRNSVRQSSADKNWFEALNQANAQFRDEIRKDLSEAKNELTESKQDLFRATERIRVLEETVLQRDKVVMELQLEIARLQERLKKYESSGQDENTKR